MIQAETILRDLAKLWTDLAQPEHGESTASGVLRACAMTLIVAAENAEDALAAGETLAELVHEHPSRAIVLKPSQSGELDARVFAQCWMPFGRRQQICCEQIEVSASPDRLGDVPGLMLGLLAPDLPVVLWCRGERWFAEPQFSQLLPLTEKLIIDSNRFHDPSEAFRLAAKLMSEGRRVADLAWGRITGWREVIAQAFDTPKELAAIGAIRKIRVGFEGDKAGPGAIYLAAWLQRALPSAAVEMIPQGGTGDCIRFVELDPVRFKAGEGCTAEVEAPWSHHTAALPPASDYEAMRDELSITGRDTVFEQTHALALRLLPGA